MPKRRGWFDFLKRIFSPDSKSKQEKKEKRKRWLFGKLESERSPALTAPAPVPLSSSVVRTMKAAEEERSKHAVAVAVATAAAADAAVVAAQAAAEVVRLTGTPISYQNRREVDAATKIQTAFRGYLARRALRALKGLVRLQALVRGRAVRRQTNIALKNLQSLIKIQTQARANRLRMSQELQAREAKDRLRRKTRKLEEGNAKKNGRWWDGSSLSKEEINALFIYRQEAARKRERALEYATSCQGKRSARRHGLPTENELEEAEKSNRRWSWLEHWVETQPWEKDIQEILPVPVPSPDQGTGDHPHSTILTTNIDSIQRHRGEQELRPTMRRSFNRSRRSCTRDDESFSSSPAFPSYMAFTESAKAKSRSISTPKLRHGATAINIFPDICTLQSSRVQSHFASVCSDASLMKLSKLQIPGHHHHQKSPRVRGSPGPMKSRCLGDSRDIKVS